MLTNALISDSMIVEESLLLFMRKLPVLFDGLVSWSMNVMEKSGEEATKGGSKSVSIEVVIEIVLRAIV